jgi:hypothetical protein
MTTAILSTAIAAIDGAASPVLVHVDFLAATAVSVVDVVDALLSGDVVAGALAVEHSADNATWVRLGGAAALGGSLRSRRFAAPPGAAVSARYWQVVLAAPADCDGRSIAIASIAFRAETDELSTARIAPHFVGDADAYTHVLSDRTAEVYSRGERRASIATPFTSGVLGLVDWAQDIDTLLLFHEAVQPYRLFRQGSATEWDSRKQAFTNIPLYQFPGETYVNGVDEVQQIVFDGFANGDTYTLTLDGESTSSIAYSSVAATNVARIKAAIEALDTIAGGTVDVANTAGSTYSVTFRGAAGAIDWPEMIAQFVTSANGIVSTATLTEGKEGGEAVMSDARGWCRSGVFWQERLILVGLKSVPQKGLASTLGGFFDFNAPGRRATDGLDFDVDANDASGIRQIIIARFPQLFTATGEFHINVDALKGDAANPIVLDQSNGIQARLRPESLDGATIYVQNGGRAVRELSYTNEAQGYVSSNVSVRAPFLISQPVDCFAQRGGFVYETDRYSLIRADGQVAQFSSLRGQDFAAWSRYATGQRSGGVDRIIAGGGEEAGGPGMAVTERRIGAGDGAPVRYVEGFDASRLLDCSVLVDVEDGDTSISGLSHLEGRPDVFAIDHDGWWFGPATVTGGVLACPWDGGMIAGAYEVGLWFDAWIDTMPFRLDAQSGSIAALKKRVVAAEVSLLNSMAPDIVYLGRAYPFSGQRFGQAVLDARPMRNLVTARLRIAHMMGWTIDGGVRIRRRAPGPLHIRAISTEVEVSF